MCYLCKAAAFIDNSVKTKSCYFRIFLLKQKNVVFFLFLFYLFEMSKLQRQCATILYTVATTAACNPKKKILSYFNFK